MAALDVYTCSADYTVDSPDVHPMVAKNSYAGIIHLVRMFNFGNILHPLSYLYVTVRTFAGRR